MKLNLEKYNTFSSANKESIAKELLNRRPEEGYTYDTFSSTFGDLVIGKYSSLNKKKDKDDRDDGISVFTRVVETEPKVVNVEEESVPEAAIVEEIMFSDMETHWAKDYAELLAEKSILKGIGNKKFAPNLGITRAEVATLLVKVAGYEITNIESGFTDVESDKWYADYVATARMHNIVAGVSDSEFEPNRIVSRQEIATMIMKLYNKSNGTIPDKDYNSFNDDDYIYQYAKNHVANAQKIRYC